MNRNTTFIHFLFIISVFLIALGFIEIILRTTHLFGTKISWVQQDPVIVWRNIPGYSFWHNKENDHPITGKFNSHGWRDKEWTLNKNQNIFRIALLGDSFVEALQVESDKTFQYLTEKEINSKHEAKVEILNFAQSGFTQSEELIILQNDVMIFSPDMVILFFLPSNDIDDISRQTAFDIYHPFYHVDDSGKLILDTSFNQQFSYKIKSIISPFKQHSALISLIAERYKMYKNQQFSHSKTNDTLSLKGYLSLATATPNPMYLKNYNLNKILIKSMTEFCKKKGIRFMLVTINLETYIPAVEDEFKSIDPTFNTYFFEDDLREYASSIGIDYLGLQRIFRKYYSASSESLQWGHWNYRGHEVVANTLTEKLRTILSQKE